MTIKKAIELLDWWLDERKKKIKELDTKFKFNDNELATALRNNEGQIIENLQLIRKELVPKCKHPKKMRDNCKGVEYCMSCNMDL